MISVEQLTTMEGSSKRPNLSEAQRKYHQDTYGNDPHLVMAKGNYYEILRILREDIKRL